MIDMWVYGTATSVSRIVGTVWRSHCRGELGIWRLLAVSNGTKVEWIVSAVCVYGPKDVLVPFVSGAWKIVELEFPSKLALLEDKHDFAVYAECSELKSTGVDYRERKATKLLFVLELRMVLWTVECHLWTVECHATKVKGVKCQYTRQIFAEVNVFLAFYERFRFLAKELCPSDVSLETPLDGSRRLVHDAGCKQCSSRVCSDETSSGCRQGCRRRGLSRSI